MAHLSRQKSKDFIMNIKGIEYHGDNEHVAYLLGYLVNIILEHTNNG